MVVGTRFSTSKTYLLDIGVTESLIYKTINDKGNQ